MAGLGIERILTVLDPGGEHKPAINAAVDLASSLGLPLHVVFAEDEALRDLADLSIAAHLALGQLTPASFTGELLDASLKVEAARCLADVKAAESRADITATFEVRRSRQDLKALGALPSDLVIVEGFSRPVTGLARLRSSWLGRLAGDGASVLVLKGNLARHAVIGGVTTAADQNRPLQIAAPIAKHLAGSVILLDADAATRRAGLRERISELRCDMVVLEENATDPAFSASMVAECRCSVLLLRRT